MYTHTDINTSRDYAGTSSISWKGSRLYNQNLQAVAICESAFPPPPSPVVNRVRVALCAVCAV
jgi:hypothetical protein